MAAATADRDDQRSEGVLKSFPVAASTLIYKGTLVGLNGSGYLVPMSDTSGLVFVGESFEQGNNSSGAAAAIAIRVRRTGEFVFNYAPGNAAQAQVGATMFMVDSQTVVDANTGYAQNQYEIGLCTEVDSASTVRVVINAQGGSLSPSDLRTSILGAPVFTVGAEIAHVVNVAVALKDIGGEPITSKTLLLAWLSATAGTAPTGPATSVAIGTNGVIVQALTAKEVFLVLSNAAGLFDLTLTDTGDNNYYLNVQTADGRVYSSPVIAT